MIRISTFCAFAALFLYSYAIGSQSIGATRILRWPDGKKAAVSLSFDDNLLSQLDIAIPEMEKYRFKGTFFIVAQWLDGFAAWDGLAKRWKEAAQRGHEIGSHSYSHSLRRLKNSRPHASNPFERIELPDQAEIRHHGSRHQKLNRFLSLS